MVDVYDGGRGWSGKEWQEDAAVTGKALEGVVVWRVRDGCWCLREIFCESTWRERGSEGKVIWKGNLVTRPCAQRHGGKAKLWLKATPWLHPAAAPGAMAGR